MSFFINENSVRAGNRGGKDRFNWEDVKVLNYKDRECYLGISEKLGRLDKGCKWIRNDWYLNKDKKNIVKLSKEEIKDLESEVKRIQEEEKKQMNEVLGIRTNETKTSSNNIQNSSNTNNKEDDSFLKRKELSKFEYNKLFGKDKEDFNQNDSSINYQVHEERKRKGLINTEYNDPTYYNQNDNDYKRKGLGVESKKDLVMNNGIASSIGKVYKLKGSSVVDNKDYINIEDNECKENVLIANKVINNTDNKDNDMRTYKKEKVLDINNANSSKDYHRNHNTHSNSKSYDAKFDKKKKKISKETKLIDSFMNQYLAK